MSSLTSAYAWRNTLVSNNDSAFNYTMIGLRRSSANRGGEGERKPGKNCISLIWNGNGSIARTDSDLKLYASAL